MTPSHLTAVPNSAADPAEAAHTDVVDLGLGPDAAARRIRQLQQEAHALARAQVEAFAHDLGVMAERAAEIAQGGEAYEVGARELASRIAEDLEQKAQLLAAITSRNE